MVASDSRPMRLRLRAELFLASFAVREESIRSKKEWTYISKYIKGILKSRLSRREQSRWNIIDDTTSMAFFEEFASLNPVFHTFLFYGRRDGEDLSFHIVGFFRLSIRGYIFFLWESF
uniref:Uncharacterized mitochondrial protein AtMg00970 n=1 Tax=Arabidopsis thaliana TaxID=3702 RepID=M970_ARATH|nr:RecName: Full=Uncharacterized mitochondrial protein AtMg00970; AltName: Full=ORF117 [Arabidopsis thaliana]CAA69837.1 unnamed protein product [Arabidopsis thaliana]